jgi:hypothetical protein
LNGVTVVIEFLRNFSKQHFFSLSLLGLRTVTNLGDHLLLDFRDFRVFGVALRIGMEEGWKFRILHNK